MSKKGREKSGATQHRYKLATAKATLAACERDLDREDDRMRGLDAKLTQLAAFSGVSISISGGLGANVLAGGNLRTGYLIALGACISVAGVLLLAAVVVAFRALAPKEYKGVDETGFIERTTHKALKRPADQVVASVCATRREVLITARRINDKKAEAAMRVFALVGSAFAALVAGLVLTAVASVV